MLDLEDHLLTEYPTWGLLLAAYAQLHDEEPALELPSAEADDESAETQGTRWFPRLMQVSGIEAKHLSRLHGRLIALGWLRFNFQDAQLGVQYRLSPEGRKALDSYTPPAESPLPAEVA